MADSHVDRLQLHFRLRIFVRESIHRTCSAVSLALLVAYAAARATGHAIEGPILGSKAKTSETWAPIPPFPRLLRKSPFPIHKNVMCVACGVVYFIKSLLVIRTFQAHFFQCLLFIDQQRNSFWSFCPRSRSADLHCLSSIE